MAGLVLLLITAAAVWNAARFDATFERVNHTHNVLAELERLLIGVMGMQSRTRTYVLSGSDQALVPFSRAQETTSEARQKLRELTKDNPDQQKALAKLDPLVADAIEGMLGRIAARRAKGIDSLWETAASLRSQEAVEHVQGLVQAMELTERRLLEERVESTRHAARSIIESAIVGSACALVFIIGSAFMVHRDFRARRAAEESLRQSAEHFRQMIDSIKDYAILMLDPAGRVVSWSSGAQRLKGYRADQIIGRSFACFYPEPEQHAGTPDRDLREAAAVGRFEYEGWRARMDGSRYWASVIITVIRDSQQRLVGFAKITRDLTNRRAAEERIRQLNTDLQLQNARLEIANKELESFSYSVSHDLRAPLRHIDGFANLLSRQAEKALDEQGRRYLAVIAESARRMGRLIDDLLTFSRMGRVHMAVAEVDHNELVATVIREAGGDRDGHVEWRVEPLPSVQADSAMLRQVWLNLLDNAVKYSSKTPAPKIEIGSIANAEPSSEHVFFVKDNGVGFDMKYAAKLFGVFQRLHSEAEFHGTGIGLANVRRIITRHGGRTWAEASPEGGATFFFSLPVTQTPTTPPPAA